MVWPEGHDYLIGKSRFKSDLIPATLLIVRFFAKQQFGIESIEAELATVDQQLEEMVEEHGDEEGLLAEVVEGEGDKRKITDKALKSRLREIGDDPDYAEECDTLLAYAAILKQQSETKKNLKSAREDLSAKIHAK